MLSGIDKDLALDVLRYYLKNPDAGDTCEGLQTAWLTDRFLTDYLNQKQKELSRFERVLQALVDLQFLGVRAAGSENFYRLNKINIAEIDRFLAR